MVKNRLIHISHFCVYIILFIGCAEIVPPPGGKVDKTKPRIINSTPINGSTQVAISNKIIIKFSERILKPISKHPVYFSPRPKSELQLDWKSDKLIITLPDSFATNQTYIISFGVGVQDLRRNPLDSGAVIAFTTGDMLSNGIISGTVFDNQNSPQNKAVVGLYEYENIEISTSIDSLYPSYIVATNNDGKYSLQYIPNGNYQVIAFLDKNNNEQLNRETEIFGVPDRNISLDSSQTQLQNINMTLSSQKEEALEIIAVRQTNNNIIKIDFNNKNIDIDQTKYSLHTYIDSLHNNQSQYLVKTDTTTSNSALVYFGVLPQGIYQLNMQYKDSLLIFDSVLVKEVVDKSNPAIARFNPSQLKVSQDSLDIYIQFSEPLIDSFIAKETFYFIDTDSNLIFPEYTFINSSLIKLKNNFLSTDKFNYKLHISEFDIIDLAGNQMGDSTTTQVINIVNPDSIGTIKGSILKSNRKDIAKPVMLHFRNISTNQIFLYYALHNKFDMQLQQGNYLLSGYMDLNNNRKRDYGDIKPLEFAEPFTKLPDTIKVRARFETSEIELEFK